MSSQTVPSLRPGHDSDASGFIALIGACWHEYPGVILDVDGELPELRALATYYANKGGVLWAAEADADIVGMVATVPHDKSGTWEICRVYTLPSTHGSGLGHRLLDRAEAHARAAGATRFVLWSDTRFDRAHRFYEKRSYIRHGAIRVLHDVSNSLEFGYAKPVAGIEPLDAASAASAERRLAELLTACVDTGASVNFLPPLAPAVARDFWQRAATAIAAGTRIVLAAWADATLVGTVTLAFPTAANQPHRAEIQQLLVHPAARRRGIARALMSRAEQEAHRAGRPLLTLDVRAGDAAEHLFRVLGWREIGRIPGLTRIADGTSSDAILFCKQLDSHDQH